MKSLRPYIFEFLGSTAPQLVGIAVSSIIVRSAGVAEFGQYSLFMSLIIFAYGTFGTALDRDFQRSGALNRMREVLLTKTLLWGVLVPLLASGVWVVAGGRAALITAGVGVGLLSWHMVQTQVVRQRISGRDSRSILPRLTPVILFFALLWLVRPGTAGGIALLFALAWASGLYYLFPLPESAPGARLKPVASMTRVWPIWFSILLTQVYGNLDLYVLRMFHSDAVIGEYKIAYTFAGMALQVIGAFSFIYLSKVSAAVRDGDVTRIDAALRRQTAICLILGGGLVFFMFFIFPAVASLLYGDAGKGAVWPARALAVAMVFNSLTMVYSYALFAFHRERTVALMTTVGVCAYLILGGIPMKEWGATGAGCAMAGSYLLLLLLYRRKYKECLAEVLARARK